MVFQLPCIQERLDGGEEPCLCAHMINVPEKGAGVEAGGVKILGRK